jgi:hypothetical protein
MPYELIALVIAAGLGVRYFFMKEASARSKAVVAVALGTSVAIWLRYPNWVFLATLLQVGVAIYVLMYLRLNPYAS